jgi:hypothetical protein
MKVPGYKGAADGSMTNGVDALAPQASVSISLGGKVERPATTRARVADVRIVKLIQRLSGEKWPYNK